MAVTKRIFGTAPDGKEVEIYRLSNKNGMYADIMTYGANLVNLVVPDADGNLADVTLGYDTLEPYTLNTDNFGATVGPNCNRIGDACFMLDGQRIQLAVNDGKNNLHTDGMNGLSKKIWTVESVSEASESDLSVCSLTMTVESKDGELGLPGNKTFRATYTLTDNNELKLRYEAQSDKNTLLNLTNHAYFNLNGHDQGSVHEHELWVNAHAFTELRAGGIPTGKILPTEGTALDFGKPAKIGAKVDSDDAQTKLVGGYDHNFVLDDYDGSLRLAARLTADRAKRCMEIYTNLPGLQVYTGNFIGRQQAKQNASYEPRVGVAMETQFFPDAPNHPEFPSTVFGPGRRYDYITVYKFC